MNDPRQRPFLDGVRVLDLSRILAGPLATLVLADLGAEVLKVEPPEGDTTRRWGPPFVDPGAPGGTGDAAYFHAINRDKASLVLDLKTDAGRERLGELAAVADVIVHNATPRAAERLGLPPILETALERDPDAGRAPAVVLEITGYRGERREEAGYDLVLQAEAGWMGITGPAAGEPHRVGVAVVDVLTGQLAASGVLAALWRRERHGVGARLGISLFQTALWSLVNVVQGHLTSGEPCRRWGNRHPNLAPYEMFHAADGPLVIGVGTGRQYERLWEVLGIGREDLRGLDNAERLARREEIHDAVATRLARRRRDEVIAALHDERVPAGPVLRPDEALARARRWDPDALLVIEHGDDSAPGRERPRLEFLASPLEAPGLRRDHRPPPRLGEGGEALAARWLDRNGR